MNLRRLFGAFLLAVTGLFVLAAPASAHAELESSSPAEGAQLATAPLEIKLTFNEPVRLQSDPFKVEGRDGTSWKLGTASAAGPVVTVPVTPAGPAQAYTVTYNLIAQDGDNMTGTLHFTLTAPVSAATTSSSAPSSSAPEIPGTPTPTSVPDVAEVGVSVPAWAWVLGALIVLAAAVVVLRLIKGRRSH
jgi:methionine-rich copper-binding protein CopC